MSFSQDLSCESKSSLKDLTIHTGHESSHSESNESFEESLYEESWTSASSTSGSSLEDEARVSGETFYKNIGIKCLGKYADPHIREITTQLANFMTHTYCYICKKYAQDQPRGHYSAAPHRQNIFSWIEGRLSILNKTVPIKQIYCEACNLSLTGPEEHYQSDRHIKMAAQYCTCCKQNFHYSVSMKEHLESEQHNQKLQEYSDSYGNLGLFHIQALKEMISPVCCHICNKLLDLVEHYKTKKHITKVMIHIKKEFGVEKKDVDSIYCGACNEVFVNISEGELHYKSLIHERNSANYCKKCRKHVKSIDVHLTTRAHSQNENPKTVKLSEHLNISETGSDTNKPEKNISLSVIRDNTTQHHKVISESSPSSETIKELANLITLSECKLCSLKLESVDEASDHYVSEGHVNIVAIWMKQRNNFSESVFNNCTSEGLKEETQTLTGTGKISKEMKLRDQISQELKKIIETILFSKKIPMEDAVVYLKRLNQKIAGIAKANNTSLNISRIDSVPDFDKATLPREITSDEQYAKIKLTMEMRRMKMVLQNNNRIPRDLAVRYVHNLNLLLHDLILKETIFYDVDNVFKIQTEFLQTEESLQEELEKMEQNMDIAAETRLDVALDCITQFNVQLESLIESQESNLLN